MTADYLANRIQEKDTTASGALLQSFIGRYVDRLRITVCGTNFSPPSSLATLFCSLGNGFMKDCASRIHGRVQITTDGHGVYLNAVEEAFGMHVDYPSSKRFTGHR